MINAITFANFKSYDSATLDLAPLTVLIGANASGKTNALEAFRLLSWIAQGNRLNTIKYAVYEGDEAVRGNTRTLFRDKEEVFSIGATLDDSDFEFEISIAIEKNDDIHISQESVTINSSNVPLYEVVGQNEGAGSDLRVAYNNFARGGKKPQVSCNDQMAILIQLQSSAIFERSHNAAQRKIPEICAKIQKSLENVIFLDPHPSAMRGYSFRTETRLKGNGSNISGVLYNLCENEGLGQKLLKLIKMLPEQDLDSIEFINTERGEVMVRLVETFGGEKRRCDATLLSDGTLRVLAIGAALLSAPRGSVVVIEEIDNGIHPSRAGRILEEINGIISEREIKILLSSHNPALLDAIPEEAIPDVVFCYRDPQSGCSELIRLEDIDEYPELISQGTIGHLLTKGIIESYVKSRPNEEEKKALYLDWLSRVS